MNIFQDFTARIEALLAGLGLTTPEGAPLEIKRFAVEPPRDATHGDLACNAAMVLAKSAGQNPTRGWRRWRSQAPASSTSA